MNGRSGFENDQIKSGYEREGYWQDFMYSKLLENSAVQAAVQGND
jgi:hypothetical protein